VVAKQRIGYPAARLHSAAATSVPVAGLSDADIAALAHYAASL